jgi:CitMHS family citrate-Mg2+:H+ or citrate-Ca2+:H+ symporter
MALFGFLSIFIFLVLIIWKKMSVMTALVFIPIAMGLLAGISGQELGKMMIEGVKQVAPTGIMLAFAVLYFATMLDVGMFDPVIQWIMKRVQGDPLKVIIGTALLTMLVHLDGDGTATFMIVISAFFPLYKQLKIKPIYLAGIVALSVGPMHLVPWSGTSARAISTLKTDAYQLFNPNIPAILAGMAWVLLVAYIWGKRERKRLGIVTVEEVQVNNPESQAHKRPRLVWLNACMTALLILTLIKAWMPPSVLFIVGSMLALLVNYPRIADQQAILRRHGNTIFFVSSMIFTAGIFSGILTGSGMIEAMAKQMIAWIPSGMGQYLPLITAITSLPASLLFTPDAYYFGVIPILSQTAQSFGIDPLEIGRAGLLGQMTVGFPISPLTASTFLLISLTEVELGEHQKHVFFWAWGSTIVMTLIALLTGSIHLLL